MKEFEIECGDVVIYGVNKAKYIVFYKDILSHQPMFINVNDIIDGKWRFLYGSYKDIHAIIDHIDLIDMVKQTF